MRIGLQIDNFTFEGGAATIGKRLGATARLMEAAGFYSLWMMDHFFQIDAVGPADMDMLEGYSVSSYLAALTSKLKLGVLVSAVNFRYPGVLVKTATTLDVLSEGRSYFGIGAGWNDEEFAGLGVPFPPLKQRFEQLEEALQIALQMWSSSEEPYNGSHYQLGRTLNVPQPISKPHPPILIGGEGERRTLPLVAKYADACNFFASPDLTEMKRKLGVLQGYCETAGRDYTTIEKTLTSVLGKKEGKWPLDPAVFLERLHQRAELGFEHTIIALLDPPDEQIVELLGSKVIPEANKIVAATGGE